MGASIELLCPGPLKLLIHNLHCKCAIPSPVHHAQPKDHPLRGRCQPVRIHRIPRVEGKRITTLPQENKSN